MRAPSGVWLWYLSVRVSLHVGVPWHPKPCYVTLHFALVVAHTGFHQGRNVRSLVACFLVAWSFRGSLARRVHSDWLVFAKGGISSPR